MVVVYIAFKILMGLAPKIILNRHILSTRKFVEANLNLEEKIQCTGIFAAVGCGLYMLGQYGAKDKFEESTTWFFNERISMIIVAVTGASSLANTFLWKLIVIMVEMKREAEFGPQNEDAEATPLPPLTEASSLWFYVGVAVTTFQYTLTFAAMVTRRHFYRVFSDFVLPFSVFAYVVSFLCQPRRQSKNDTRKSVLHFISYACICEGSLIVWSVRQEDYVFGQWFTPS